MTDLDQRIPTASATTASLNRARLLRRGFILEWITLGWNGIGILVLAIAAIAASSVALAGFALDSLIEVGASAVVIWQLSGSGEERQRRALQLIGIAFVLLAIYLTLQSTWVLAIGHHAGHSPAGVAWTAITAAVMFALAVLSGLVLNSTAGWWWADPAAAYVLVYYALREARAALTQH